MTAVRARRQLVAVIIIAFGSVFSQLAASELNDSIQLFHQGDYQNAYRGLTALVQKGEQDARVHYYRGLISFRQGNRPAAAADFQTAMQLEANGATHGVSDALQRVQGHERLVIEKYRAMARLAAKQKRQPVAPPPVLPVTGPVQLVTAETPVSHRPLFRLASEVPIRDPKRADPFADDVEGILADDRPDKPILMQSESSSTLGQPVGTGVAESDAGEAVDPFAGLDDLEAEDFASGTTKSAGPTSVMGSVFRALFRANVPNVQNALPTGVAPGFPAADRAANDQSQSDDFPFGEEPDGEEDPFGDF